LLSERTSPADAREEKEMKERAITSLVIAVLFPSACALGPEPMLSLEPDHVPIVSVTGRVVPETWDMVSNKGGGASRRCWSKRASGSEIEMILKTLFRRKTRTLLTLLGISIGVAAIVALVA
jgi:hypothetical protein